MTQPKAVDEGGSSSRPSPYKPPAKPTSRRQPWLFELGRRDTAGRPRRLAYVGADLIRPRYYRCSPDALKRSWDLLTQHLTPKQIERLITKGDIVVKKDDPKLTLGIVATYHTVNVFERGLFGRCTGRYCSLPAYSVRMVNYPPLWDILLAQYLAIECNWPYWKKTAHRMGA